MKKQHAGWENEAVLKFLVIVTRVKIAKLIKMDEKSQLVLGKALSNWSFSFSS